MWKYLVKFGFWIGILTIGPLTVISTIGLVPVLGTAAIVQLL